MYSGRRASFPTFLALALFFYVTKSGGFAAVLTFFPPLPFPLPLSRVSIHSLVSEVLRTPLVVTSPRRRKETFRWDLCVDLWSHCVTDYNWNSVSSILFARNSPPFRLCKEDQAQPSPLAYFFGTCPSSTPLHISNFRVRSWANLRPLF